MLQICVWDSVLERASFESKREVVLSPCLLLPKLEAPTNALNLFLAPITATDEVTRVIYDTVRTSKRSQTPMQQIIDV